VKELVKCDYCLWPAEVRCKSHKQHICGRRYCIQLHRYGRGNCVYVDPTPAWKRHAVGLISGFVFGLVILGMVAL
jgi:hypothetical protein